MLQAAVDPALAVVKEFPFTSVERVLDELCHGCPGAAFQHSDDARVYLKPEIIHLNHHAALHASWKPEHVRAIRQLGYGVVVTQHDTFEDAEIMWERGMPDFRVADYLIVHEKVAGLTKRAVSTSYDDGKVFTLRQPVPDYPEIRLSELALKKAWPVGRGNRVLGLFGFDFPWKGFDMAVRAASAAGWEVLVLSPGMPEARQAELKAAHRDPSAVEVIDDYAPTIDSVVVSLRMCDASAFLYSTGNSGTSSAIRAGIAARKPVIALKGCRQFRDLELDKGHGQLAVNWAASEVEVVRVLKELATNQAWYSMNCLRTEQLAIMDSWKTAGNTYGLIYRELQDRLLRDKEAKRG
jgi:hypothetical protein